MIKKLCDNTDHQGEHLNIRKIRLIKDFNFDICFWCRACRERDNDMIKKIYPKTYLVSYRDEFETIVNAENEEEAVSKAEQSDEWRLKLQEGHKDFFECQEIE